MADWKRMERHHRYNRIATAVRIVAILLVCDEFCYAIKDHFPWWDDVAIPLTFLVHQIAKFVQKYTRIYRFDCDLRPEGTRQPNL